MNNLPAAARRSADRAAELIRTNGGVPPAEAPDAKNEELKAEITRLTTANARLQEKYNAETPRLMRENAAFVKRVAELEAAETKKQVAAATLTDEEKAVIGDELREVTQKIAREAAESAVAPLRQQVGDFQKQSEAVYLATLDRECPGWEAQNDDPKFVAWLQEADSATKQTRNNLLQTAHAAKQGYRTAEIFNAFREGREIGARAPAKLESPDPDPGPGNLPKADDKGKRQWTRAEIQQFYREKRTRKWVGREAEARAIEVDISAASSEGRIKG